MIQLHAWSAAKIATERLPGPSVVLRMADDPGLLPTIADQANVLHQQDLIFHDANENYTGVHPATKAHAETILGLWNKAQLDCRVEHFVSQCQAGIGRSMAVCCALSRTMGYDPKEARARGTYNRKLYAEILTAAGLEVEQEPLVSIAVRVKYQPDRLLAFLLSLKAQRYTNWEAFAFTDGHNKDASRIVAQLDDPRIRVLQTPEPRGRWGHPYRQLAFDYCKGDWIGTQNDDNYLTPGFLEQMVAAGESADLVECDILHRYNGWRVTPGNDLCAWLARREVVRQTLWTGTGFTADQEYFAALVRNAARGVRRVEVPLVVKN